MVRKSQANNSPTIENGTISAAEIEGHEVQLPPAAPAAPEEAEDVKEERAIVKVLSKLEPQYSMDWTQQRDLIRSETPLTERGVSIAVQVARSFRLPLQGINVIASRVGVNVYVNSDGVRWRLHTDPRTITYSNAEIIHRPSKDEPWVEVQATIVMGHGENASTYVNYGVVECQPGPGVANAILKAVTKAKRRAGVDAVGVALPIFEDYLEYQEERGSTTVLRPAAKDSDVVDAEFKRVAPAADGPKSFPDLLALANTLGYDYNAMMAALGTTDIAAVTADLAGAAKRLKEAKEGS